jgi:hypothetical protein
MVYLNIAINWKGYVSEDFAADLPLGEKLDLDTIYELLHESSCTRIKAEVNNGPE